MRGPVGPVVVDGTLLRFLEAELELLQPPPEAAPDHAALRIGQLSTEMAAGGGHALAGEEPPRSRFGADPGEGLVAVVAQHLPENGVEEFEVQLGLLHGVRPHILRLCDAPGAPETK